MNRNTDSFIFGRFIPNFQSTATPDVIVPWLIKYSNMMSLKSHYRGGKVRLLGIRFSLSCMQSGIYSKSFCSIVENKLTKQWIVIAWNIIVIELVRYVKLMRLQYNLEIVVYYPLDFFVGFVIKHKFEFK